MAFIFHFAPHVIGNSFAWKGISWWVVALSAIVVPVGSATPNTFFCCFASEASGFLVTDLAADVTEMAEQRSDSLTCRWWKEDVPWNKVLLGYYEPKCMPSGP